MHTHTHLQRFAIFPALSTIAGEFSHTAVLAVSIDSVSLVCSIVTLRLLSEDLVFTSRRPRDVVCAWNVLAQAVRSDRTPTRLDLTFLSAGPSVFISLSFAVRCGSVATGVAVTVLCTSKPLRVAHELLASRRRMLIQRQPLRGKLFPRRRVRISWRQRDWWTLVYWFCASQYSSI